MNARTSARKQTEMGTSRANLTGLKVGSPRELEQAFIDVHGRIDSVHNTLLALKQQVANLPTAQQLQQHVATIEKAVSSYTAFDLTIPGISTPHKPQGSILPVVIGAFAYTSDGTSITWYWDGTNGSSLLTLRWPDGSLTPIPPTSQRISGLAGTTTYTFFPYYDTVFGGIVFSSDSVAGTGTPPMAFGAGADIKTATAIQSQDNHVQMNLSTMSAATTAGGGGGGSGGGRFGGCVAEDTEVVPLSGDLYSYLVPASDWIEIRSLSGRKLRAVPEHRIFTEDGCLRMAHLAPGMRALTLDGLEHIRSVERVQEEGKKRVVWVPKGNVYWANGFGSHNIK